MVFIIQKFPVAEFLGKNGFYIPNQKINRKTTKLCNKNIKNVLKNE